MKRRHDSLLVWDRKDPAFWYALYRDEAPVIGVPLSVKQAQVAAVLLAVTLSPVAVSLFNAYGIVAPTALATAAATLAALYRPRDSALIAITAFAFLLATLSPPPSYIFPILIIALAAAHCIWADAICQSFVRWITADLPRFESRYYGELFRVRFAPAGELREEEPELLLSLAHDSEKSFFQKNALAKNYLPLCRVNQLHAKAALCYLLAMPLGAGLLSTTLFNKFETHFWVSPIVSTAVWVTPLYCAYVASLLDTRLEIPCFAAIRDKFVAAFFVTDEHEEMPWEEPEEPDHDIPEFRIQQRSDAALAIQLWYASPHSHRFRCVLLLFITSTILVNCCCLFPLAPHAVKTSVISYLEARDLPHTLVNVSRFVNERPANWFAAAGEQLLFGKDLSCLMPVLVSLTVSCAASLGFFECLRVLVTPLSSGYAHFIKLASEEVEAGVVAELSPEDLRHRPRREREA